MHLAATSGQTKTDWPTIVVAVAFWISFVAIVLANHHLPTVIVLAVLAVLGGLYMSLQHEVIHGHPTRVRWLNWLSVAAPLGMVLPLDRYRDTHLEHHRAVLTDPLSDPESKYVSAEAWQRSIAPYRWLLFVNQTLAGRLTVGPVLAVVRSIRSDLREMRTRPIVRRAWLLHLIGLAALVVALRAVSMPLWIYAVGFVFGGSSLTSLRAFVEHLAVERGPRTAMVHTGWFFSLIFLNNNLHYAHHEAPAVSWFRLPALAQELDADSATAGAAGVYRGYANIARRFLFRPFGHPVHPISATIDA